MTTTAVAGEVIARGAELACRVLTLHNSQPSRWVATPAAGDCPLTHSTESAASRDIIRDLMVTKADRAVFGLCRLGTGEVSPCAATGELNSGPAARRLIISRHVTDKLTNSPGQLGLRTLWCRDTRMIEYPYEIPHLG